MLNLYEQKTNLIIEQLYLKISPKLMKYILRYTHNTYVAEDIIQDTFEVVIRKKEVLVRHENVEGWIFLICRHMLNKYISANKVCVVNIESVDYVIESKCFELYTTFMVSMDLMRNLDSEEKNIILLHFLFGYKFNEIATMKRIQEGACKMKCYRAIKKIQKDNL